MKKLLSVIALSLCAHVAFADELPSEKKMDAVHACISEAGIDMPKKGEGKPPKLTSEQKAIIDNCFAQNGVERPSKEKMEAVRKCAAESGVEMPKPGEGKPEFTEAQREIVDSCFEENGLKSPKKHREK